MILYFLHVSLDNQFHRSYLFELRFSWSFWLVSYYFLCICICRFQWLVIYLTLVRQWTSCCCHWCMHTTALSKHTCMLFIILPDINFNVLCICRGTSIVLSFGSLINLFSRYKWNFFAVSLHERLDFFESNWAFFAGFGMFRIYDLMGDAYNMLFSL